MSKIDEKTGLSLKEFECLHWARRAGIDKIDISIVDIQKTINDIHTGAAQGPAINNKNPMEYLQGVINDENIFKAVKTLQDKGYINIIHRESNDNMDIDAITSIAELSEYKAEVTPKGMQAYNNYALVTRVANTNTGRD